MLEDKAFDEAPALGNHNRLITQVNDRIIIVLRWKNERQIRLQAGKFGQLFPQKISKTFQRIGG